MQVRPELHELSAREVSEFKKNAPWIAGGFLLWWGVMTWLVGVPSRQFILLACPVGVILFGLFYAQIWYRISLQWVTVGFLMLGTVSMVISTLYGNEDTLLLRFLRPLQFASLAILVATCLLSVYCSHLQKRFSDKLG